MAAASSSASRRTAFRCSKQRIQQLRSDQAALANGIELPYACKGGVCGTCRCKRLSGEVDMDANYSLEDYELARGFILSCQSFPVSDTLTLDFDQET